MKFIHELLSKQYIRLVAHGMRSLADVSSNINMRACVYVRAVDLYFHTDNPFVSLSAIVCLCMCVFVWFTD